MTLSDAIRAMYALALVSWLGVNFIVAPYGRHAREGWGPTIPQWIGWMVMESPAVFAVTWFFLQGPERSVASWALLALWMSHYLNRTFVYPLRLSAPQRPMPVLIPAMAFGFQLLNGYVQGTQLGAGYAASWLLSPQFWAGVALFGAGQWINHQSDAILLALRAPGETGYKIPTGGLYRWVSCPNYLGELIIWTGWAVATWSSAGLSFAVYTFANLAPRAAANHRWYREQFPDYPPERRALIPFIW